MVDDGEATGPSEEQLLYARILAAGMYTGLVILLATFVLYVTGLVDPAVPIHRLPDYWSLGVQEYLEAVNAEYLHRDHGLRGWWWLGALSSGDYLNFVGIIVLAAVTVVCYLGIVPVLLRKRDVVYVGIAVAEAVILVLAASGLLAAGH